MAEPIPPYFKQSSAFNKTRHTLIDRACSSDEKTRKKAMEEFCILYWSPFYHYARYRGYGEDMAKHQTQEFMTKVSDENLLAGFDAAVGRLSTLLLTIFCNQLSSAAKGVGAQKRGGGLEHVQLSEEFPDDGYTARDAYDYHWARRTLDSAIEEAKIDKSIKDYVVGGSEEDGEALAQSLGISYEALRTRVSRARRKIAKILYKEVGDDEELASLNYCLRRGPGPTAETLPVKQPLAIA